ncbi:MBOAT, membrane-bound O-acyltransferase family-domain-containing protein [Truncatella angustata]|uniref:MBOAT, membrane-bound O-acyltransferase family-domain-containing protein n=1 Tax=Truncatella angustata TaxID=152316 RepID=A0A9P8UU73_9PEZI|nr:MBOAT, membrane-bound O-acyltransferase family-domain-containing protein [Truncatella angustata]KAH6658587.1 MBOAT, membrane-bound O-acyltransferase family-domain-containing protein [Truncatella angustata]
MSYLGPFRAFGQDPLRELLCICLAVPLGLSTHFFARARLVPQPGCPCSFLSTSLRVTGTDLEAQRTIPAGPVHLDWFDTVQQTCLDEAVFNVAVHVVPYFCEWTQPSQEASKPPGGNMARSLLIPVMKCFVQGLLWFSSHLILLNVFPRSRLLNLSEDDSFWFRTIITCATSVTFRFAYYGFWTLAEAGILSCGINAPRSIDPLAIEFALEVDQFWHNWNRTTQQWLSRCIYRRLPSRCQGLTGVYITFLICGVWHDLRSRYLIWGPTAGTITCLSLYFRRRHSGALRKYIINADGRSSLKFILVTMRWVLAQSTFAFVTAPYLTSNLAECFQVWSNANFLGLLGTILLAAY